MTYYPSQHRPMGLALLMCVLFALPGTLAGAWAGPDRSAAPADQSVTTDAGRITVNLAGTWQGRTINGLKLRYPPDTGQWKTIDLPSGRPITNDHTLLIKSSPYSPSVKELLTANGKAVKPQWKKRAAAWFRRRFSVKASWLTGHRAMLYLRGASFRNRIWINGKQVGQSLIGEVPATYDVTRFLKPGADNQIVVAVGNAATLLDIPGKTLLAPASGVSAGLWGRVVIRFVPPVYVKNVFITTSVSNKQISARVKLVNTRSTPAKVRLSGLVTNSNGRLMTNLPSVNVSMSPNEAKTIDLKKHWLAPTLWSPTSPALYHLTVSVHRRSTILDQYRQRFGFRQFEIRGKDFYLNGHRITLLRNSVLTTLDAKLSRALGEARRDAGKPFNCWRLHIGFDSDAMLNAADQIGLMTMPESAWHNASGKFNFAKARLWLPQVEAYTKGLIEHDRNHPSVIMWSLTNETMWNHIDNLRMSIAHQVLQAARQADDTRPFSGDGDNTWDGQLSVINIHYPEGKMTGKLARQYPNAGLLYPNMFHWFHQRGINHSWRADFKWDRPLIIGEYWYVGETNPVDTTSYAGDLAFDWAHQQFGDYGHDDYPMDPRMWALRGMTDVYRNQGVAGVNPWFGDRNKVMAPVAVHPLDFHPNFFGGQPGVRRVVVFNQTPHHYDYMHLQCRLVVAHQTVWSGRVNSYVGPYDHKAFTIHMDIPDVTRPTKARLIVRLIHERGGNWPQLARYHETIFIWPGQSLKKVSTRGLLVIANGSATAAALKQLGADVPVSKRLGAGDLSKARTVLLGPGVTTGYMKTTLLKFIRSGGRVIQLRTSAEDSLTPLAPSPDPFHAATRAWRLDYSHPILRGLDDGMFSFWRPNNLVSRSTLRMHMGGPVRYLLDSGGRFGMRWSPLAELRLGKGTLLMCQMPLVRRVKVEPAAAAILVRLVRYAQQFKPAPTHRLVVLAAPNQPLWKVLHGLGVATAKQLADDNGPVLVDASARLTSSQIITLKQRLKDGGKLWLTGFTPATIGRVAGLLPFKPILQPFKDKKILGAVIRSHDELVDNITNQDLAWYSYGGARGGFFAGSKPTAQLGKYVLKAPNLDVSTKLIEPGMLVKIPVGRGVILFDTLEWPAAYAVEHDKVAQLVSALAMNLGASFAGDDPALDYSFVPINIAKQANMGYYDQVAGDGKGGWTDQGENDMRFFLVNQVGKIGGREQGMDIASARMPSHATFLGVPFALIDPKTHHGRAVISLRGGEHASALPSQAKGIRVGRRADRLWFLDAAGWTGPRGTLVARYVIHYQDGGEAVFSVHSGSEIGDWWNPRPLSHAQVAWAGRNLVHSSVGIYLTSWTNPHPHKIIQSIDVIGNLSPAQVVVVAITAGIKKNRSSSN